jgi:ferritin-like metal-binding protein YciE
VAADIQKELVDALADAHAMEKQSLTTLRAAVQVAGDAQLKALYTGHVAETNRHLEMVEARLKAHEGSHSMLKDLGGRISALALGSGLVAQKNTPVKLVAVAYGFESFEIASYELLKRIAERAGDGETVTMCNRILVNERQAAEKLAASYDLALQAAGVVEDGAENPAGVSEPTEPPKAGGADA